MKGDRNGLKEASQMFLVEKSPSIILFKDGQEYTQFSYKKLIKEEEFKFWLDKLLLPSITILKTKEELENFLKKLKYKAIIGYFKNEEEKKKNRIFKELRSFKDVHIHFEDFGIAAMFNKELVEKKGENLIEIFKNEKEILNYKEKDLSNFYSWIVLNVYPKVSKYTPDVYFRALQSNLPISILYLNGTEKLNENKKYIKYLNEKLSNLKEFEGKLLFSFSDEMKSQEQLDDMSKKNNTKLPLFAVLFATEQYKVYLYNKTEEIFGSENVGDEKNEKDLIGWINQVFDGKIKPDIEHQLDNEEFNEPTEEELKSKYPSYLDEKPPQFDENDESLKMPSIKTPRTPRTPNIKEKKLKKDEL